MKCPKCGSEVKPNYKFCSKCGQPMEDAGSVSLKSITIDSDENFKARQKPKEEPGEEEEVSDGKEAEKAEEAING